MVVVVRFRRVAGIGQVRHMAIESDVVKYPLKVGGSARPMNRLVLESLRVSSSASHAVLAPAVSPPAQSIVVSHSRYRPRNLGGAGVEDKAPRLALVVAEAPHRLVAHDLYCSGWVQTLQRSRLHVHPPTPRHHTHN